MLSSTTPFNVMNVVVLADIHVILDDRVSINVELEKDPLTLLTWCQIHGC